MPPYGENYDYGNSPRYKDEGDEFIPDIIGEEEFLDELAFEGDIKIVPDSGMIELADIQMADRDLLRDPGFETAILMSLFTNRRADPDDILPDNTDDKEGWWGDILNEDGDQDGSRLWLIGRHKNTTEVLPRAEEYITEALQWMVDDKIADKVKVTINRLDMMSIQFSIEIYRPLKSNTITYKYYYNWEAQKAGRVA